MGIKTISSVVKEMRRKSGLSITDFANQNHISSSLLKRYENGEHDCPSPLIASNYCKNFGILPKDLVSEYKLSNDKSFDKQVFLDSISHLYYNVGFSSESIPVSLDVILEIFQLDNYKKTIYEKNNKFSDGTLYSNKDLIGYRHFDYVKVQNNQSIIEANHQIIDFIEDKLFLPPWSENNDKTTFHKYIISTPSKDAFKAIASYSMHSPYHYINKKAKNGYSSSIDIMLVYLPFMQPKKAMYFDVIGKDFINIKERYYSL